MPTSDQGSVKHKTAYLLKFDLFAKTRSSIYLSTVRPSMGKLAVEVNLGSRTLFDTVNMNMSAA